MDEREELISRDERIFMGNVILQPHCQQKGCLNRGLCPCLNQNNAAEELGISGLLLSYTYYTY